MYRARTRHHCHAMTCCPGDAKAYDMSWLLSKSASLDARDDEAASHRRSAAQAKLPES